MMRVSATIMASDLNMVALKPEISEVLIRAEFH